MTYPSTFPISPLWLISSKRFIDEWEIKKEYQKVEWLKASCSHFSSKSSPPINMAFDPLGIPSWMNMGHIFECSLGLVGGPLCIEKA